MSVGPVPRATYRLQLNKDLRFRDAEALAPYLQRLGISHVYLSPILRARAGSTHGYDMVEPTELNPEIGTIDEFRRMAGTFRRHRLGIILDIVPNHMGIGGTENRYWLDVLEYGKASPCAGWFDIDWRSAAPSLAGKVLVPCLDRPLDEALAKGILELRYDAAEESFAVFVHDHHKLPLDPVTYPAVFGASPALAVLGAAFAAAERPHAAMLKAKLCEALANDGAAAALKQRLAHFNGAGGRAELAALLERQHWRLAKGSVADDEINYRRFFIISDLAGIRIERDEVFDAVHALVFQLVEEGLVDGLRIDHIDGLFDPKAYCLKLRQRLTRPVYLVVEKILAADEPLPADWEIDGTTGYDFAALVNPLLVDPQAEDVLTAFHREFTGVTETPAEIERACKLRVMEHELAAEVDSLSQRLATLAGTGRDLTRLGLKRALVGFIAALSVYRTYVDANGASPADGTAIEDALAAAAARDRDLDPAAMRFLGDVLTGEPGPAAREVAMRIQQFTGPVMAKGLEDTALYRCNRLLSLDDVGERPEPFSLSVAAFHAANRERARSFPHSMLGTSSHDSKRGEDSRARIAAISGHTAVWTEAVPEWIAAVDAAGLPKIDSDDAYHFFQLLLGSWPGHSSPEFADRMIGTMRKSLREARLRTSWTRPDEAYESVVEAFIRGALRDGAENAFLSAFRQFETAVAAHGVANSLIETTLKLTLPGVPDIYQGAELWEQSMVDPDNRRPVDFARRQELLAEGGSLPALLARWPDGGVKQAVIARLLAVRARQPALFADGSYEPVEVLGPDASRICAFLRRNEEAALLVAVRLFPWRESLEEPATIELPDGTFGRTWIDTLAGQPVTIDRAGRLAFRDGLPIVVRLAVD